MKMNVHILGQHVGVLEQVGDFKSVMAYLPDVAPESLVSLKDWQVELASVYARAVPPRGRPKRVSPVGGLKGSITKKRLRISLAGR